MQNPIDTSPASASGLSRRSVLGGLAAAALTSFTLRAEAQPLSPAPIPARRHPGRIACGVNAVSVDAPPRMFHATALLGDGSVLVTGGISYGQTPSASAFLYLPQTGEWKAVAPMNHARAQHASAALGDGRIVVLGGRFVTQTPLSSVEIYDPSQDEWTLGKAMPVPRFGHSAVSLGNGSVMVIGGSHRSALAVVHTYHVFGDKWESDDALGAAAAF